MLMLAYGCLYSGRPDQAEAIVTQLESTVNVAKLSASSRALLVIVRADAEYERSLELAMAGGEEHLAEMGKHLAAAADAYEQARSSDAFSSEPALRQLFALREADILISAGNLWQVLSPPEADAFYSRALEVSAQASKLDGPLSVQLLDRAIEAQKALPR
jgi:hypothetical protein